MMQTSRVDDIIQFALALASLNEDWKNRELGPIHLVKYVYLADLAHAQTHQGITFTGAAWKFHHFGPWNNEIFGRIEPALKAIHATMKQIPSDYDKDFRRWSIKDPALADVIEQRLDFSVVLALRSLVREFGSETEELLHHVYATLPMLHAGPGETLDFLAASVPPFTNEDVETIATMSAGQRKRFEMKKSKIRARLQERLAEYNEKKTSRISHKAPRYDDIYDEGMAFLNSLGGEDIPESRLVCEISDEIWKSKARHDPDLSR